MLVTSISQLIVVAPDLTSGFTTVQDKSDIEKLSKLTIVPSFASSCELSYVREEQQVSQQTILWYSRDRHMAIVALPICFMNVLGCTIIHIKILLAWGTFSRSML